MNPVKLREIVAATGVIPVDYEEEMLCCGTGTGNTEEEPAMQILSNKLTSAINAGAEAMIVNCPACFQQFDNNQKKAGEIRGKSFDIPVLYVTELLALVFGETPDDIGLKFHRTRLTKFLEKYGLK